MWKISFTGGKVPVESNEADIEPVEDNPQHRQNGCKFNQGQTFCPNTESIKKAWQRYKTQKLYEIPDSISGCKLMPVIFSGYTQNLNGEVSRQNI